MQTFTPFYIYSVERADLSAAENAEAVANERFGHEIIGIPFKEVLGKWQGGHETAFLVLDRELALDMARVYEQDAVLFVDANRAAFLIDPHTMDTQPVGVWREIVGESIESAHNATIDLETGKAYQVVERAI